MDTGIINQVPISAIIPTADRANALKRTLESLSKQNYQPDEILVIDASIDTLVQELCKTQFEGLHSVIRYYNAAQKGAASQRVQGLEVAKNRVVFFMDDDIILEPFCIERLWQYLQSDEQAGGVNAMIMNQRYHTPGKVTRFMYFLMSGQKIDSYAGKCIGPAWNLLPEDREELPYINEVQWLNTTCTLYRVNALPDPLFPDHFQGYSLMEDLCLSLSVGKKWKLYNVRNARIFHDSQPGIHKNNVVRLSAMELINRYYIMINILNRSGFIYIGKLFLFEVFGIIGLLSNTRGMKIIIPTILGKFAGIGNILFTKNKRAQ